MEISTFLEVGISLIFVYLLSSVIVSNLNEVLVSLTNQRGKQLVEAMESVLNDSQLNKNFAHLLYAHPQVERTRRNRKRWPAYVAPRVFAQTLIDLIGEEASLQQVSQSSATGLIQVVDDPGTGDQLERFRTGVEQLNYSDLKVLLRSFSRQSTHYDGLVESIESWYQDYMDRVTGWYKLRIRPQVFFIGLLVTISLNIDTIAITKALWQQSTLRSQIVKAADAYVVNNQDSIRTVQDLESQIGTLKSTYGQLTQLQLPIGWDLPTGNSNGTQSDGSTESFMSWLPRLVGWLLTSVALVFGAPFWFDILRYFVNVRQAGIKPEPRPKPPVS